MFFGPMYVYYTQQSTRHSSYVGSMLGVSVKDDETTISQHCVMYVFAGHCLILLHDSPEPGTGVVVTHTACNISDCRFNPAFIYKETQCPVVQIQYCGETTVGEVVCSAAKTRISNHVCSNRHHSQKVPLAHFMCS